MGKLSHQAGDGVTQCFSDFPGEGTSLVDQWLGLGAFTALDLGSIPGRGAKIPQASRPELESNCF